MEFQTKGNDVKLTQKIVKNIKHKMKVTVCFGAVRIVVPCKEDPFLVKDLINEAVHRYKKATAKEPDSWVAVHHLQTDLGILDADDCVRDVADDCAEILASFEESGPDPGVPQGGGDGASGSSSVGTGSPDIFRDPTNTDAPTKGHHHPHPHHNHHRHVADVSAPHIEVTSTTSYPANGLGLQVRRSSDPNLLASLKAEGSGNKRWSAAAPHCAGDSPERVLLEKNTTGYLSPQWEEEDDLPQQQLLNVTPTQQQHNAFARSGRLSMQFLGDGTGYKWMEAAEKLQHQQQPGKSSQSIHVQGHNIYATKSLPRENKRKEPLGQAYESIREKDGEMLLIINEKGSPLGLTAIPDNKQGGGLLVQHVEPGGRADRGRLRPGDRLLEINGTKLIGLTEGKMLEHWRRAADSTELRMRVLRGDRKSEHKTRRRDSKVAEMIEAEEKLASALETKVATVSPTRKSHMAAVGNTMQLANTRKLGRKIEIALRKGPNGLGFSVTTRDNQASRDCPIYIKNILPRGAAIEDGRLKPGDRLLEVDGIPMTGKTQTDVVAILRATQPGATVQLVVSRQQELVEESEIEKKEQVLKSPAKLPAPVPPKSTPKHQQQQQQQLSNGVLKSSSARSLFEQNKNQQQQQLNASQHFIDAGSESAASTDSIQAGVAWRSREVITLHIPVHDTEKAGLGVSVKGKTSSTAPNLSSSANTSNGSVKHDGDLGIFVKNVIHGGAASRDGRLRMNDQLLSVNGVSLLGQNNAEAMETLRRAMVNQPGKHPGMITLTVARRISRSASSSDILEQANDSSNTSENSGTTVIYLTPEKTDTRGHKSGAASSSSTNDMHRWSNPVLDRLTGGACSQIPAGHQGSGTGGGAARRPSRDNLVRGGGVSNMMNNNNNNVQNVNVANNALRNDSYYLATHETWSPSLHTPTPHHLQNGHVLIEDDAEPLSPLLPHNVTNDSVSTLNSKIGSMASNSGTTGILGFDATYSSQLSLETNNSSVEHFSRDALGRRSISEKHHAALDARETGTYQRNKKVREERERERRIQLTKSAVFSGSMESLTARIANANSQIPGYKHTKTLSSIEKQQQQQRQQQLQAEARDIVADLGPSLGMKKSSSLESLQTMVQEIQMSDDVRGGPSALRAPRGRGRDDSLRAAVVGEHDVNKPRKHWLLEEHTDAADGGFTQRNGPFQSSLNDGKHKTRAKKPSILRGIGHMFRFGKNRKDTVVPNENTAQQAVNNHLAQNSIATATTTTTTAATTTISTMLNTQAIPAAALAALDHNAKLVPPAYQPPPPLPPAPHHHNNNNKNNHNNNHHNNNINSINNNGIHQSDVFNHRYQHYANYEELQQQHQQQQQQPQQAPPQVPQHQMRLPRNFENYDYNHNHDDAVDSYNNNNNNNDDDNDDHHDDVLRANINDDVLSESTLECMRQQVIRQRIKVEAESRRHQHYHSQRSTRSQDINFIALHSTPTYNKNTNNISISKNIISNNNNNINLNKNLRPTSSYYEYETVQHNNNSNNNSNSSAIMQQRIGSIKLHNGLNLSNAQRQTPSPVTQPRSWKSATMNGFSPASLNSSARSRGPYITHVTIREQQHQHQSQPVYQSIQHQQHPHPQQQHLSTQTQASKV